MLRGSYLPLWAERLVNAIVVSYMLSVITVRPVIGWPIRVNDRNSIRFHGIFIGDEQRSFIRLWTDVLYGRLSHNVARLTNPELVYRSALAQDVLPRLLLAGVGGGLIIGLLLRIFVG